MRPVVAIHAGAGERARGLSDAESRLIAGGLEDALEAARSALDGGAGALGAVKAAIVVMESFELFNAGRGSALCADGAVEMSAALMRADREAGAVAGVEHTEHPILGAAVVLESPQVLVAGPGADALAAAAGLAQRSRAYFISGRQLGRLDAPPAAEAEHATVGAVCLDGAGELAAGTSTGGVRGQPRGRVGDSPLIGAGTWADARVAVSCTGDGEAFIRAGAARYLAALAEQGVPLGQAAARALAEVQAFGGRGGLVALDADGCAALPFLSEVMPRGVWRAGESPAVWAA
jgi:beta-aspartyl-peptidase (threonine type)